ncbi:MAG: NAD(+)/NADH kinase [Bacteroidota bacterium]|nr:NAD(+)/NADH kinase [Bacteroidota bacterium]
MLSTIAIYSKENNPKTTEVVKRLIDEFCRLGIRMQVYQKSIDGNLCRSGDSIEKFSDLHSLKNLPELVLSVGGDGTFLETVLKVRELGIPIAGINTGRMGFLANISEDEIGHSIDLLCEGDYEVVERTMIGITHPLGLFSGESAIALNEITIQKADLSMITISVYINNAYLNTYWADGLIVSTATGSTAYNLSTGGPILSPEDRSLIISPISAHNLTIRPLVVSGECNLRMVVEGRTKDYLATCDFRSVRLPFTEEIHIERSGIKLKTVMLKGKDFYNTLRNKLMWGVDRRN